QQLVRVLAVLLRVAIGLDRSHDRRVTSLRVHVRGKQLVVEVRARGRADLELELYTANERTALLAEVLERPVAVVAAAHPSTFTPG
ncbi:MAG: hypothetical protein JWM12_2896, partial [Ilumatobacteraceae bacterium]|nr:hypothetical protein [Ilumatobacteraceae bacterium]